MDEDTKCRCAGQHELLQKILVSTEKTRKYFMWTMILSLVFFVLSLIAIMVLLPAIMGGVMAGYGGGF